MNHIVPLRVPGWRLALAAVGVPVRAGRHRPRGRHLRRDQWPPTTLELAAHYVLALRYVRYSALNLGARLASYGAVAAAVALATL